jgi:hypothetical protein
MRTEQRKKEPRLCTPGALGALENEQGASQGARRVERFADQENKSCAQGARGITNSFGATEIE